jgi:hypothetical protein
MSQKTIRNDDKINSTKLDSYFSFMRGAKSANSELFKDFCNEAKMEKNIQIGEFISSSFLISLYIAALAFTSCGSSQDKNNKESAKQFPKPGTVVASAEMPVADDSLNHFVFSVKVIADSNIRSGVYDVDVDYGPNFAEGQFTMPKGGEDFVPVIRKVNASKFIIGFKVPRDTTFYDYFEVSSNKKSTRMQYLKGYTF